jgi:hypothetical protein
MLNAPLNGLSRPSAANTYEQCALVTHKAVFALAMADTVDSHGMQRITPRILAAACGLGLAGDDLLGFASAGKPSPPRSTSHVTNTTQPN